MNCNDFAPTFIFIGPDKTGSSWMYRICREHPDCFVPTIKDIYFFDRYYHRGMEWYLSFFREARGYKAIGEFSHDYMFSIDACHRIKRHLPDVTLVTCLRDPVDRAFSQYLFMVRSGITKLPFEDAIRKYPFIIENSMYYKYLSKYWNEFPMKQIKLLFFDDLVEDPRKFGRTFLQAIGLAFLPALDYEQKTLPASKPRSYAVARAMRLGAQTARTLRLERLVGAVKQSPLTKLLYREIPEREKPRVAEDTRKRLLERFLNDIECLEKKLDISLDSWKR